jgi:hypothetical protein
MSWPEHECEALQRFLLHKCSKSLHCAMKMYWLLLSMAPYCSLESERQRCLDLAKACEITVINSCMPKYLSQPPPCCLAASDAAETDDAEIDSLLVRSLRIIERLRALEPHLQAQFNRLQLAPPDPLGLPNVDATPINVSATC